MWLGEFKSLFSEMTYYPIKPKISPEKTEALKASAALVSLVLEAEK